MQYRISLFLNTKQENIHSLIKKIRKQYKNSTVTAIDDTTIMCEITIDENVDHLISKINSILRIDRATLYDIGTPEPETTDNEKNIENKEKPSIFHWTILVPLLGGPSITLVTLIGAVIALQPKGDLTILAVIGIPTFVHFVTQSIHLLGAIGNAHLKTVKNYYQSKVSAKNT